MLIALAIVVLAVAVAYLAQKRRTPDAPTQRRFNVPEQIDRNDFDRPEAPWLVAVFTSDTCDKCVEVAAKAAVLASDQVVVQNLEFIAARDIHDRYKIDAVPTLIIVDSQGVTQRSFLGPMSATDLWAAVAEVREPGSTPDACGDHGRE
ncbi:MAG: hypothetical protein ACJAR2_003319 [Ilumatobacter sp.]